MVYADLLDQDVIQSNFLAVLCPRRRVESWTLFSGSVYRVAWSSTSVTQGYVDSVQADGNTLTQASSTSLNVNEFYFDDLNSFLYIRIQTQDGGTNPNNYFITVASEIYVSTQGAQFFRLPTDSTTKVVYFEPVISSLPVLKSATSELLYGFNPVQTSQIILTNIEHFFDELVYNTSFNKASIRIYHLVGEDLDDTSNIELVFEGTMSDISYTDTTVTIKVFDRIDIFSREYRHSIYFPSTNSYVKVRAGDNFYGLNSNATLNDVDPNVFGKPRRVIYGRVDGIVATPYVYSLSNPTAIRWHVSAIYPPAGLGGDPRHLFYDIDVAASPSSTTTRTYLTSAQGITVDDTVAFFVSNSATYYAKVTDVNYVSNYIDHTAIASPMTSGSGNFVRRPVLSRVIVYDGGVRSELLYLQDYTITTGVGHLTVVTAAFSRDAKVICRVYGAYNQLELNGSAFGGNHSELGVMTNSVVILYDLMRRLGVPESKFNEDSWRNALADVDDDLSFSIPQNLGDSFPSYRELITSILQSTLLKLYIDNDSKWALKKVEPISSTDSDLDDSEIRESSFNYDINYSDIISNIVCEYAYEEDRDTVDIRRPFSKQSSYNSDIAEKLHQVQKQQTFKTYHFDPDQADRFTRRLGYALGEKRGLITVSTSLKFFDSLINDVFNITRTQMPGGTYDGETEFIREAALVEINRSSNGVTLVLDDQKGIEDNSGSW